MNTEMPAEFAVHAEPDGRAYVVAPAGELDLGTVGPLRDLIAARPATCERLVLDLSGLTFFDTSGMRLVIETMHEARERGIELALVRGPEDVQRLFAIARVEDRLPFFDDRRAALAGG
jgi:anti-sigma B factor antagonist